MRFPSIALPGSLVLVFVGVAPAGAASQDLPTTTIAQQATPATVTIRTLDARGGTLGQGSGFIVRGDGVIVTNYHVMRGASRAIVRLPSGEKFERVHVLEVAEERDLAILKIPGFGMPSLLPATALPVPGQAVVAIGAPLGLESTITEGIVSAVRLLDGQQWIQISAPISPGSSGGPVLDRQGRVLAVATAYRADGQALGFAVPIHYAMGLIGETSTNGRTIAQVFAGGVDSNARDQAADGIGPPIVFGRPASSARASWLLGSYRLTGRSYIRGEDGRRLSGRYRGVLLIAGPETGIYAKAFLREDDTAGRPLVYVLTRGTVNDNGRVHLLVGESLRHAGYFMDDRSIALVSDISSSEHELLDSAVATPYVVDPDLEGGVYEVTWRARFAADKWANPSGNLIRWSGKAALLTYGDSVWVDLTVQNARNGSTYFRGAGLIRDGSFTLTMEDGSRLAGTVDRGHLQAEFIDRRESGARYAGMLVGTRTKERQ